MPAGGGGLARPVIALPQRGCSRAELTARPQGHRGAGRGGKGGKILWEQAQSVPCTAGTASPSAEPLVNFHIPVRDSSHPRYQSRQPEVFCAARVFNGVVHGRRLHGEHQRWANEIVTSGSGVVTEDAHAVRVAGHVKVTCGFLALAAVDVGEVVVAALRLTHAALRGFLVRHGALPGISSLLAAGTPPLHRRHSYNLLFLRLGEMAPPGFARLGSNFTSTRNDSEVMPTMVKATLPLASRSGLARISIIWPGMTLAKVYGFIPGGFLS
ncbi:hypothetical protein EYF80_002415 [Liparis tanakae]|uniref:Uncharacterized protein n=1 Tax=Liparis tanakae TaxID=230148 RepID=A0A4Z2JBT0_9TELE|nr:hypothetical protein EYF80_002415 [Liparis tanakae]